MMRSALIFLIYIPILSPLSSLENNSYKLTTFGGMPATTVAGGVNIITGNYSIFEEDYVVKSQEKLAITRTYSSDRNEEGHVYEN